MFDVCVLIHAFQPPEATSLGALGLALASAREVRLVLTGHRSARSPRHPFTARERVEMLAEVLEPGERARVRVLPVVDALRDDALWADRVRRAVEADLPPGARVAVMAAGHGPSGPFPGWTPLALPEGWSDDGALFREAWLSDPARVPGGLHPAVAARVEAFGRSPEGGRLALEAASYRAYRERWRGAPYPVIFSTADALVLQGGAVLLVERGRLPGKGLWALPGGFLEPNERILDGALRELREETGLAVPEAVLRAGLRGSRVFDHPLRSLRGRVLTHAFRFDLEDGPRPALSAGDDAARAFWMPLADLEANLERFFDDHAELVEVLAGLS